MESKTLKSILKSIDRKQWLFVLGVCAVTILVTSASVIYGWLVAPEGAALSGIHSFSAGDSNVYHSYINQIKDGSHLLKNQFTTEVQELGIFNVHWWTVGKMAAVLDLSAQLALQVARVIFIPLLLVVSYIFLSYFFAEREKRRLGLLLVAFSSGLGAYFSSIGWLVGHRYYHAADLWMAESTFFNSMFHLPHFVLASALILGIIFAFSLALDNKKYRYSLAAGLMALVLFNFHPYHLPTIYLVPMIYAFYMIRLGKVKFWQAFNHYSILVLVSIPSVLYHLYTLTDPIIGARGLQNETMSSPFVFYVLGLGLLMLLGLFGMIRVFENEKKYPPQFFLMVIWILTALVLTYLPTWQFQRRLIQAVQFPLIILTIESLYYLRKTVPLSSKVKAWLRQPAVLGIAALILFAPTSLYNLANDAALFGQHYPDFYHTSDLQEMMSWVDEQPSAIFHSSETTANNIAGNTHQVVYLGHAHETIDSSTKRILTLGYFETKLYEPYGETFVKSRDIDFVVWGPYEIEEFPLFKPQEKQYLNTVYENETYKVFEVR